jgi:hypothetical protein
VVSNCFLVVIQDRDFAAALIPQTRQTYKKDEVDQEDDAEGTQVIYEVDRAHTHLFVLVVQCACRVQLEKPVGPGFDVYEIEGSDCHQLGEKCHRVCRHANFK